MVWGIAAVVIWIVGSAFIKAWRGKNEEDDGEDIRKRSNASTRPVPTPLEVEFTEATRKVRITCPFCRQLNQIEIILPSDRGGIADRVGPPENGAKMKIVVLPGD